jgi:hypothetical protein
LGYKKKLEITAQGKFKKPGSLNHDHRRTHEHVVPRHRSRDSRAWTCVYDRQRCEQIVRLRRAGVCLPAAQKLWR